MFVLPFGSNRQRDALRQQPCSPEARPSDVRVEPRVGRRASGSRQKRRQRLEFGVEDVGHLTELGLPVKMFMREIGSCPWTLWHLKGTSISVVPSSS